MQVDLPAFLNPPVSSPPPTTQDGNSNSDSPQKEGITPQPIKEALYAKIPARKIEIKLQSGIQYKGTSGSTTQGEEGAPTAPTVSIGEELLKAMTEDCTLTLIGKNRGEICPRENVENQTPLRFAHQRYFGGGGTS